MGVHHFTSSLFDNIESYLIMVHTILYLWTSQYENWQTHILVRIPTQQSIKWFAQENEHGELAKINFQRLLHKHNVVFCQTKAVEYNMVGNVRTVYVDDCQVHACRLTT